VIGVYRLVLNGYALTCYEPAVLWLTTDLSTGQSFLEIVYCKNPYDYFHFMESTLTQFTPNQYTIGHLTHAGCSHLKYCCKLYLDKDSAN